MRPSVQTMPIGPLRPRWVVLDLACAESGHWFEAHIENGFLIQDEAGNVLPHWCQVARLTGIAQLFATGYGVLRFRVGLFACRRDARHRVEAWVAQASASIAAEQLAAEAQEAQRG